MNNLAVAYEAAGMRDKIEPLLRDLAAILKRKAGAESPPYATTLGTLGLNLLMQKIWADAEPILRECLTISEKAEPDAWTTFNTKSQLGGSLLGQQKSADAEPLLLAGYDGLKQRAAKIPPAGKIRLPEAAFRLVQLYDALGKPAESAKWLDEAWAWAESPAKP